MDEQIQNIGRDLVMAVARVLRTLQSHGADNQAVLGGLDRLAHEIDVNLQALGTLQLNVVDDMLLLNGTRLRVPSTQVAQFEAVAHDLTSRGLGGVAFRTRVGTDALRTFFSLIAHRVETQEQMAHLREAIFRYASSGIEPLELRTMTTTEADEELRVATMKYALHAYTRAILSFREFVAAIKAGRSPYANKLGVVRTVQDLIDTSFSRVDMLLYALQMGKARGAGVELAYPEVHAANTCVYAVLIGRALALDRGALLDLGTAALLADAASAVLPQDGARRQNAVLGAEERAQLQHEMTRAVQGLLGHEHGNEDAVLLRTIVAYEQHRPIVDASGRDAGPLHIMSRIIAVAGAFDAMTSDRPWRAAMSVEEAMQTLTRESGTKFDPLVVGILSSLVGTYLVTGAQA